VSTGPYMLEGSGAMDFTLPPDDQVGAAGYALEPFSPETDVLERIVLVRNPSWDPSTDPLRPAYVDRIEVTNHDRDWWEAVEAAGSLAEVYNAFYYDMQEQHALEIDRGLVDLSLSTIPSAEQVRRYMADPLLRDRLVTGTGDRLYYSAFNLAVPPFDDVHVRRAVSLALDRARVAGLINDERDYLGATVANHVAPDGSEGFLLETVRIRTPPEPRCGCRATTPMATVGVTRRSAEMCRSSSSGPRSSCSPGGP
jgi:ABC-type transport system substrate-binding protein